MTHCTPIARREVYELVANRVPVIASHIGVQSMNPEPYNLDESDVRGSEPWWDSILDAVRSCDVFVRAVSEQSLTARLR